MNTISTSAPANAACGELAGKAAIVTGSTSGIGLGIAQALASAGVDVMLNGFGDVAEISRIRKDIEQSFGVKTIYSAADMSMPGDIEGIRAQGLWQSRHTRQQRRHPACGGGRDLSAREVGHYHSD